MATLLFISTYGSTWLSNDGRAPLPTQYARDGRQSVPSLILARGDEVIREGRDRLAYTLAEYHLKFDVRGGVTWWGGFQTEPDGWGETNIQHVYGRLTTAFGHQMAFGAGQLEPDWPADPVVVVIPQPPKPWPELPNEEVVSAWVLGVIAEICHFGRVVVVP